MDLPFFTIVIPALNEKRTLPKLLSDLKRQSYTSFEVYVVDGRSEDGTREIIKTAAKDDRRFHLMESKIRNVGAQRNEGSERAKGEYLLFFDADNRLPDYYLAGVHYACSKESPDGFTTYAAPDTDNAKDKVFLSFSNMLFESAAAVNMPFAFGACIGCRRAIFARLNGFDKKIAFGEDTEFVRRLAKKGYKFVVFREPTYTYSLRRFRKEGTLRLIRNLAPQGLKMIMNKKTTTPLDVYPMLGGSYFNTVVRKKRKTFGLLQELSVTLKEIINSNKE